MLHHRKRNKSNTAEEQYVAQRSTAVTLLSAKSTIDAVQATHDEVSKRRKRAEIRQETSTQRQYKKHVGKGKQGSTVLVHDTIFLAPKRYGWVNLGHSSVSCVHRTTTHDSTAFWRRAHLHSFHHQSRHDTPS